MDMEHYHTKAAPTQRVLKHEVRRREKLSSSTSSRMAPTAAEEECLDGSARGSGSARSRSTGRTRVRLSGSMLLHATEPFDVLDDKDWKEEAEEEEEEQMSK